MNLTIKRRINADTAIELQVDGTDQAELVLAVSWVSELSTHCGECDSTDIGLRTRRVKNDGDEYNYPEQFCRNCRATRSAGQYKSPKGILFMKPDWRPAYQNGGQE